MTFGLFTELWSHEVVITNKANRNWGTLFLGKTSINESFDPGAEGAPPLDLSSAVMTWSRAVPVSSLSADHVSTHLVQSLRSPPPKPMSLWVDAFGDCPKTITKY